MVYKGLQAIQEIIRIHQQLAADCLKVFNSYLALSLNSLLWDVGHHEGHFTGNTGGNRVVARSNYSGSQPGGSL